MEDRPGQGDGERRRGGKEGGGSGGSKLAEHHHEAHHRQPVADETHPEGRAEGADIQAGQPFRRGRESEIDQARDHAFDQGDLERVLGRNFLGEVVIEAPGQRGA